MSSLTSNKREPQRWSQPSAHPPAPHKRNWSVIAGYALMFGGASMALTGCQSGSGLSVSAGDSKPLIDFNTADSAQNQAQGRAFTARLNANTSDYQQLFDTAHYPNSETQAKLHLLAAIRQHLATEHVAVSQASYHSVPFIKPDSIDAGSSSLLRTMIELYAYKNSDSDDYNDDDTEEAVEAPEIDNDNEDDASVAVAESAVTTAEEVEYDDDGYNEYGVDAYGYDRDGYDQDGYNEYGNQREDGDYSGGLLSGMKGLNPKELLTTYDAMQSQKQRTAAKQEEASPAYGGIVGQMLGMFSRTPEQIAALNAYQYQYFSVNSVSQYRPQQKQFQSVYSYDYLAPTISASVQVPVALDFNNNRITVDPSAFLPLVALANPENAPLPTQMTSHTVDFGLPEKITSQIPSAVIYEAIIAGVQDSMAELAPDYFSAVDIRNDKFAQEVGAARAVKVYFGSQQSGEMIGKMVKYMSRYLQNYVDANPDKYPDDAGLKIAIAKIQQYNQGYQSADIGALLQLVEAIGPINFNHTNYYYLDRSDRLLAKQQRVNIGGDLLAAQTTVVNQTRYDTASFNQHALTPLLKESFGAKATPSIDGNAWIEKMQQQKNRLQAARYARYDYDENYKDSDSDNYNDTDNIDEVEGATDDTQ